MLVPAKITKIAPTHHEFGAVQFINLKSYDEDCLLRQCFTISITTIKTVTQTQAKPICLSKVDSFYPLPLQSWFLHVWWKWFPCRFHFRTVFDCSFLPFILAEITFHMTVCQ